ncbi:unnamed protein product [Protopolystoma xenopodis]|uniref:Uncharacterized protein n=1 Tax=Protopolystoma xenopodis TaxID=117903 RepID=A0A448XIG8_9PLAT|nr:unnamed protein product [Protopolystoma xenopodis]
MFPVGRSVGPSVGRLVSRPASRPAGQPASQPVGQLVDGRQDWPDGAACRLSASDNLPLEGANETVIVEGLRTAWALIRASTDGPTGTDSSVEASLQSRTPQALLRPATLSWPRLAHLPAGGDVGRCREAVGCRVL